MSKRQKSQKRSRLEASVKVHAIAKATATYKREKKITEVIPPDVTRAKNSAWLDLISPITHWAGLKGDRLKHQRELLRIQQEAVLTKIISDAIEELKNAEVQEIGPLPHKFLIPFLEKASIESEDSELVAAWTNLLTSAAIDFDPHMVRFCTILAEIGPSEVKFLSRLCRESRGEKRLTRIDDAPLLFYPTELAKSINEQFKQNKSAKQNIQSVIASNEIPGGIILSLATFSTRPNDHYDLAHDLAGREFDSSISLLQSLGIVDSHTLVSGSIWQFEWHGRAVSLTQFGLRFIRACDKEIRTVLQAADEQTEREIEELRREK